MGERGLKELQDSGVQDSGFCASVKLSRVSGFKVGFQVAEIARFGIWAGFGTWNLPPCGRLGFRTSLPSLGDRGEAVGHVSELQTHARGKIASPA